MRGRSNKKGPGAGPSLETRGRNASRSQKISGHQGLRSVRKRASARATAPSLASSTRPARSEVGEGEPAEVDGAERVHREPQIRRHRRVEPSSAKRPSFQGQNASLTSRTSSPSSGVRPRGQRGADVHEPDPEAVADPELHPVLLEEQQEERVVDGQELGLDVGHPVDVEEVAPDRGGGGGRHAHRLDDDGLAGRNPVGVGEVQPVDRVRLGLPVALQDDERELAAAGAAPLGVGERPLLPPRPPAGDHARRLGGRPCRRPAGRG